MNVFSSEIVALMSAILASATRDNHGIPVEAVEELMRAQGAPELDNSTVDRIFTLHLESEGLIEKRKGVGYCLAGAVSPKKYDRDAASRKHLSAEDVDPSLVEAIDFALTSKLAKSPEASFDFLAGKLEDRFDATQTSTAMLQFAVMTCLVNRYEVVKGGKIKATAKR